MKGDINFEVLGTIGMLHRKEVITCLKLYRINESY